MRRPASLGLAVALRTHWLPTLSSNNSLVTISLFYLFWRVLSYCRDRDLRLTLQIIFWAAFFYGWWTMGFVIGVGPVVGTFTLHGAWCAPVVNASDLSTLHKVNSIHYPSLVSRLTQERVSRKLDKYYVTGGAAFKAKVDGLLKTVEELLALECCDRVMSMATNRFNLADKDSTCGSNAEQRSSAKLGKATAHHIARGARAEAGCYIEAAKADRLTTETHAKITSALGNHFRCAYANFAVGIRTGEYESSRDALVAVLEGRGEKLGGAVNLEFRAQFAAAAGSAIKVLALGQSGPMELPGGHADFDTRMVPRLCGMVASFTEAAARVPGNNVGRFVQHPIHAWFLLIVTLHFGLALPTEAARLLAARWEWGRGFTYDLRDHLLGREEEEEEKKKKKKKKKKPSRWTTWYGCTVVYIFLTDELYAKLSAKLLAPHFSLNLCDAEVYDLILEAATSEECKVVGDDENLHAYFKGRDWFHCPKTWVETPVEG